MLTRLWTTRQHRLRALAAGLVAAALWMSPSGAMTLGDARDHVHVLGESAEATLTRAGIGEVEREAAFAELMERSVALDTIGRYVLGAGADEISEVQRERFQSLFKRYLVQTYATRMNDLTEMGYRIVGAERTGEADALVTMSVAVLPGLDREVVWRVREIDDGYRVVDLVVGGISMAATLRQEFGSVIRMRGLDGLMDILEAKTGRLVASKE